MTIPDALSLLLFPCLLVNWATFAVFAVIAREHPGIRALIDRRWLSLGIAVLNTSLVFVAAAYFLRVPLGAEWLALLLTGGVFLLTGVNLVALWLTWRRGW